MKELLTLTGGYPRQMDYLLGMQIEVLTMGNALFGTLGFDMVISGCAVTDNHNGTVNIAQGLIYLGGEVLRCDGASNVVSDGSQTFVKSGYVTSGPLTFADTSSKNVYREAKAIPGASTIGNTTEIKIKTTLYTFRQYVQDSVQSYEVKGSYKEIYDFDGTFLTNFDSSGLGVTPRWQGWALDNGDNGTPGSIGRALIASGVYSDSSGAATFGHGTKPGLLSPKQAANQVAKPAGTATGWTGPHNKPADGGGVGVYYATGITGADVDAANGMSVLSPSLVIYRVIKIVD